MGAMHREVTSEESTGALDIILASQGQGFSDICTACLNETPATGDTCWTSADVLDTIMSGSHRLRPCVYTLLLLPVQIGTPVNANTCQYQHSTD